jgi:hypothetical protein
MKKFSLITAIFVVALLLPSCKPTSTLQKDIKYMRLHFKPLSQNDYTLVGNLQAESTTAGTITAKGKALAKEYTANYKKGLMSRTEVTEMMFFAPSEGQVITGSLYDNDIFNTVFGSASIAQPAAHISLLAKLMGAKAQPKTLSDYGMEFAYFAMIEKYPDVDYFINVRFDRKTIVTGKTYTETIVIKADGIKLKTD